MKNRAIKVVKKNEEAQMQNVRVAANLSKITTNAENNTVQTVNDWVSEWRKNSRSEKIASDGVIKVWNLMV